ncbi:MAG: DNA helicase [Bacteroidetes bacterium]|nr:DNA helicase [Bacteroidota bacterium]
MTPPKKGKKSANQLQIFTEKTSVQTTPIGQTVDEALYSVLTKQDEISFPDAFLLAASAGSGKTTELTHRYVQFLLSNWVPHNRLRNVLAITFTNNAAAEMKQKTLRLLKNISLGRRQEIQTILPLVSLDEETLRSKAGILVEEILEDYSDFQVQTIDSFLARVFKASALEFGFTTDFEIMLDSRPLLTEAFEMFARGVGEGTESAELLIQLVDILPELRGSGKRYAWNPYSDLARNVKNLYQSLIQSSRAMSTKDYTGEMRIAGNNLKERVLKLDGVLENSTLTRHHNFAKYVQEARAGKIDRLAGLKFTDPPFIKKDSGRMYATMLAQTEELRKEIHGLRSALVVLRARSYFQPYVRTHQIIGQTLDRLRRQQGKMFIGDVANKLAQYIDRNNVPEIYFSLGEKIHHYLIDEFQDTSPIQWKNLEPLIEESLGKGGGESGSLFVVGDMKQSIYSFRGADWRIMKRMTSEDVFPSAPFTRKELPFNFRSAERIVRFNEEIFRNLVPLRVTNGAASETGLAALHQNVPPGLQGKGYVETQFVEGDPETRPERTKILAIINDCLARGYSLRDIAILTPENQDVIQVSGWLNEAGYEFIPYSTLDIRTRKVIGEIIAFLRFLDSPIDNLSFGTFLLGNTFKELLRVEGHSLQTTDLHRFVAGVQSGTGPLYVKFKNQFPALWARFFEELFALAGYLPLYDLTSDVLKCMRAFEIAPNEEAALVKLLEVVTKFEERGENSLKEFIGFAGEDFRDADWNIEVPPDVNAVKIMTVHKAKGLGFRVVVVLLYDVALRTNRFFVEETEAGIELVRLVAKEAEEAPELAALFQQKDLQERVDQLNKLYVALTRAGEEMYVVSVKYTKFDEPSAFLPQKEYEPSQKPAVLSDRAKGDKTVSLAHHSMRRTQRMEMPERMNPEETKRGELIHRMLSRIEYIDGGMASMVKQTIGVERESGSLFDENAAMKTLNDFLEMREIQEFFPKKHGAHVSNEQDIVAANGKLYRMDRVIRVGDMVTVVDYKTGGENDAYADQVREYVRVLQGVYPTHHVRGFLAYVDKKIVRRIDEGR